MPTIYINSLVEIINTASLAWVRMYGYGICERINDDKIENTKKHGPFNVHNVTLYIIYRYNASIAS